MKSLKEFAFSDIRNLIRGDVDIFDSEDTVSKVLGELSETDHYEAVIKSEDKVGLVTAMDLLDVVQPSHTKIGEHPKDLWSIYQVATPGQSVLDVIEIMIKNKIRAVPVVENKEVVGLISQVDIVEELKDIPELSSIPSEKLMRTPVITLDIDEKIAHARRIMIDKGFSHVPVVQNGKLVGIVTAKNIVLNFVAPLGTVTVGDRIGEMIPRFTGKLGDIMDSYPLTAETETSSQEIAIRMMELGKSACVITVEDEVVGIITPRELIEPMMKFRGEEEFPVYIVGLSEVGDFLERTVVEDKIRRVIKRAMKIHPHLSEVSITIKPSRTGGIRTRYEVAVNVYSKTTEEQFDVEKDGWDLLKVFDELSDVLDRVLRESKHEPKSLSKEEKLIRHSLWFRP